ncbi:MAG: PEP-CTERM sorting domain-containing protein [Bacteroidetes bacterium]|nr:PEP-CTERM sorting domain-containing protein [Bacteroidota bacterium]
MTYKLEVNDYKPLENTLKFDEQANNPLSDLTNDEKVADLEYNLKSTGVAPAAATAGLLLATGLTLATAKNSDAVPMYTTTDDNQFGITYDWETGELSMENLNTAYDPLESGFAWNFTTPTFGLTLDAPAPGWNNTTTTSSANTSSNLGADTNNLYDQLYTGNPGTNVLGLESWVGTTTLGGHLINGQIETLSGYSNFSLDAHISMVVEGTGHTGTENPNPVPEPATALLMATGIVAATIAQRKKSSKRYIINQTGNC